LLGFTKSQRHQKKTLIVEIGDLRPFCGWKNVNLQASNCATVEKLRRLSRLWWAPGLDRTPTKKNSYDNLLTFCGTVACEPSVGDLVEQLSSIMEKHNPGPLICPRSQQNGLKLPCSSWGVNQTKYEKENKKN
jgi:hypothetical protein